MIIWIQESAAHEHKWIWFPLGLEQALSHATGLITEKLGACKITTWPFTGDWIIRAQVVSRDLSFISSPFTQSVTPNHINWKHQVIKVIGMTPWAWSGQSQSVSEGNKKTGNQISIPEACSVCYSRTGISASCISKLEFFLMKKWKWKRGYREIRMMARLFGNSLSIPFSQMAHQNRVHYIVRRSWIQIPVM